MAAPIAASALLSIQKARQEYLTLGLAAFDGVMPGLPRGAISELTGPRSAGRTSFLHAALAAATGRSEYCALIDGRGGFDPASGERAGVDLSKLIWIRCGGNLEHAIKSADLILHGGGFGLVCLDLADTPAKALNRIPISYWYRFRRAIQDSPTVFVTLADAPQAKSCAACWVEFRRRAPAWTGRKPFRLLRGLAAEAVVWKPGPTKALSFTCDGYAASAGLLR
ncbi:MAG: hypothetical protein KIT09_19535 [Bryobacteraceae bacterium]|nr:hypothetical protein [Bryobacteraceae bacterium]